MKKQWILLLVLAIALTSAPAAMAAHCQRCRPLTQSCGPAPNFGYQTCEWDVFENNCYLVTACGSHLNAAPSEPLASEYTVASVERLDEPNAPADATQVASLATPSTPNR